MSDTHARTVHASSVLERLFERGGGEGGSRGVGEIDPADPMLFARIGLFIDPAGAFLGARPREGDRVFPLSSIRRQVDVVTPRRTGHDRAPRPRTLEPTSAARAPPGRSGGRRIIPFGIYKFESARCIR